MSEFTLVPLLCLTFFPPSMDFIDDPTESILTAVIEIPGIKTNDISLHISNGLLVVLGERRPAYRDNATQQSEALPQDTAGNSIQAPKLIIPIQELRYGTFRRTIRIPESLKVSFRYIFTLNPPDIFASLSFSIGLTRTRCFL